MRLDRTIAKMAQKDETARLGAFRITALVGKFLFDISKPITDFGGHIYLYKGDGLIGLWDWDTAVRGNKILRAVDGIFAAVRREHGEYHRQFGVAPTFRVGIHGGDVVVSEQGDTKRAIGVYGDTINIAARMEEAARTHNVACVISGYVAEAPSFALQGIIWGFNWKHAGQAEKVASVFWAA